jgi:carboxyl-terminal processing protease
MFLPLNKPKLQRGMKGDFVGIGVSFYMYKDSVAIIQPYCKWPFGKSRNKAG